MPDQQLAARARAVGAIIVTAAIAVAAVIDLVIVSAGRPTMVIGAAVGAAAAVGGSVVLLIRHRAPGRRLRNACEGTLILLFLCWLAALGYTFPRTGADLHDRTPTGAAAISFGPCLAVAGIIAAVMRWRRGAFEPGNLHTPDCAIELWHVHAKKHDYYIAHGDCGWVGPAHDGNEADAVAQARKDAREHGANVASEIVDMGL